jgi:hypothetical protein
MTYGRKLLNIDLVNSEEQFRNYLSRRSYGSKRMMIVFNRTFFFKKPTFSSDAKRAALWKDYSYRPSISRLELAASKEKENKGEVFIDTGYFRIKEDGTLLPSQSDQAPCGSLDTWQEKGIEGLRLINSITEDIISLYEEIFPGSKNR